MENADPELSLLRHALATLAYRAGKALRNAPHEFASYRASPVTRTPVEILAHMGDLLDWSLTIANSEQRWRESEPLAWDAEIARFFAALEALDGRLDDTRPIGAPIERLFQGPIADALTHTGQLAMLRNMAGVPMGGENYYVADIQQGRVGRIQSAPVREF